MGLKNKIMTGVVGGARGASRADDVDDRTKEVLYNWVPLCFSTHQIP
jgi:hypothetical protein